MKTLLTSALISISLIASSLAPARAYIQIIPHEGECQGGWTVVYDPEGHPVYYVCVDDYS